MAAERNFWQVLIMGAKYQGGVYMRVLEYPSKELADETIAAVVKANTVQNSAYLGAYPLYPSE
jgi:hypothetical protein